MASSKSIEKSSHLAFLGLKRLLNEVGCGTITGWTVTQIGRCCVRGIGSRTDFSHISEMFEDTKMRSGLYPFFHIALLNDFSSFALWMSDNLFESAHCSTACCCLPTPMTLASGGSPMFPLVVPQPASPSIWPAVQSLRRGLSTNPGATMWCVCGCS